SSLSYSCTFIVSPSSLFSFSLHSSLFHLYLHSFPTRRSSDLSDRLVRRSIRAVSPVLVALARRLVPHCARRLPRRAVLVRPAQQDRKSTRLNSSHGSISYAVFCLKKKKVVVRSGTFCC